MNKITRVQMVEFLKKEIAFEISDELGSTVRVAMLQAILAALEENKKLRELLWIRHGCDVSALYGDDGEMQCGACLLDFLEDSPNIIEKRFRAIGQKKLDEAALEGPGEEERMNLDDWFSRIRARAESISEWSAADKENANKIHEFILGKPEGK